MSMLWHASQFPVGDSPTAGALCMVGSAIYFIVTGMPNSHTRIDLSSLVDTNRRPSSTNVREFTAPKCWSYSCTTSPTFQSYCMIFLSVCPASKMFCCPSSGCDFTQFATEPLDTVEITRPVSVSQSMTFLSHPVLTNRVPSFQKVISFKAFWCAV